MSIPETTQAAMKMALKKKRTNIETIFHSDRGFQYCNPTFVKENLEKNIKPSMSAKGNPYENAAAERLNGILKYEFDLKEEFNCYIVAKKEINKAINLYNQYRIHFSINLKTPKEIYYNPEVLNN